MLHRNTSNFRAGFHPQFWAPGVEFFLCKVCSKACGRPNLSHFVLAGMQRMGHRTYSSIISGQFLRELPVQIIFGRAWQDHCLQTWASLPIVGLEHHFKLTGWCFVGPIWFQNLPCPSSLFMLTFLGDPRSSPMWPHRGMLWLILMHEMFPQNNKMLLEANYTVKLSNLEILGASWKIQSHMQNAVSASYYIHISTYMYM